jgi:hypothetical protein
MKTSQPLFMRLALAASLLIALSLSAWWLTQNPASTDQERDWDANRQNLPDIGELEMRIQSNLFAQEDQATQEMGADIDQVIDEQAMDAKLAGLTKNVTTSRQPTEQELEAFYQQHQADYREPSLFSFSHILFSSSSYGGRAYEVAAEAMDNIADGTQQAEQISRASSEQLSRDFGAGFAEKVLSLVQTDAPQCWTNPIASRHGVHLLCISEVKLGDIPKLAQVRSQVINDWRFKIVESD